MIFSSVIFLFYFLPAVLLVYLLLNESLRNLWLLLASLAFYGWASGPYVLGLLASILFNFGCGLVIERVPSSARWRRWIFGAAVTVNLLFLAYVKYATFFLMNLRNCAGWLGWSWALAADSVPQIPLLGVSFFSFHCISYLADIYRGEVKAERSLLRAALYVAVFPQLLAGPIVLYRQIHRQLLRRRFLLSEFEEGVLRFILGLSKKVLISDVLAVPVDTFFSVDPRALNPSMAWVAVPLFALQVYFDFSGYSDMAVGLGLMFGFRFPENFAYPYTASNLAVFWTRWHMSLTNWFRSYLFFPLTQGSGRRNSALKIVAIFGLVGLWHGASWSFLLFGLWNGLAFVLEAGLSCYAWYPKVSRIYLWLVLWVGLTVFRAPSLGFAAAMLLASLGRPGADAWANSFGIRAFLTPYVLLMISIAVPCCTALPWRLVRRWETSDSLWARFTYAPCRIVFLLGLFFLCSASIAAGTYRSFIYFQF